MAEERTIELIGNEYKHASALAGQVYYHLDLAKAEVLRLEKELILKIDTMKALNNEAFAINEKKKKEGDVSAS